MTKMVQHGDLASMSVFIAVLSGSRLCMLIEIGNSFL